MPYRIKQIREKSEYLSGSKMSSTTRYISTAMELAKEVPYLLDYIERLEREIEYLRRYGNRDCLNMADEAMKRKE